MAFNLIKHTDLERLAESFAQRYSSRPHGMHPLASDYLIVQTPGMKKWLALQTARQCGSFARVDVLTPVQFIMKLGVLTLNVRESRSIFEQDILPWALFRILDTEIKRGEPTIGTLADYCRDSSEDPVFRQFSLARSLADLFDQYMLARPDWLAFWEKSQRIPRRVVADAGTFTHETFPDRPEELWQAHLWRKLLELGGDNPSRADYFERLEKALGAPSITARIPGRIFLFGMSLLPARFLHIFSLLGRHCDVTLFLQVPSVHYTGDLQDDTTLRRIAAHHPGVSLEQLKFAGGNRLLANLGTAGREFMDMVLAQTPQEAEECWAQEDDTNPADSLLSAIRSDICFCRDPRREALKVTESRWSIRIARCTGELREVEVLHDLLLESLRDIPGLSPSDILVITPDIERYGPLIDLVFGGSKDRCGASIPYSIADRSLLSENRPLRLAADILSAAAGRFSLAETLPLFEESCSVSGTALDSSQRELVRSRCIDAGIRWGLNEKFKQKIGVSGDNALTWEAGLDRLFAGFAVDGNESLADSLFPTAGFVGQGAELLGRLSRFIDTLGKLASLDSLQRTCIEWVNDIRPLLTALVSPAGETSEDDPQDPLHHAFDTIIERAVNAGIADSAIPFSLFVHVLSAELSAPSSDSRFLTGKLTVAGMVPMRSIPFKVIAMLGMNRGTFPRHTVQPEYDLMRQEHRPGDRDALAMDRYLFLEIILAAQTRLIITASGLTDDKTPAPSSSVVEEFIDELKREYLLDGVCAGQAVTVRYPLQPGSPRYRSQAPENMRLLTFNHRWFSEPAAGAVPDNLFTWRAQPSGETPAIVDGGEICRALADPTAWFIQHACGIRRRLEEDELPRTELFALDNLSEWEVRNSLANEQIAGAGSAVERLKADGKIQPGIPGEFAVATGKNVVRGRIEQLFTVMENPQFVTKHYRIERGGISYYHTAFIASGANSAVLFDPGKVKAKRRLRHWVAHLFENLTAPVKTTLVCLDTTLSLAPIESGEAEAILRDLADLSRETACSFLALFPEAAWAWQDAFAKIDKHGKPVDPIAQAWKQMEKPLGRKNDQSYGENPWLIRAFGEAQSFAEAGIEKEFCALSKRLFGRLAEVTSESA